MKFLPIQSHCIKSLHNYDGCESGWARENMAYCRHADNGKYDEDKLKSVSDFQRFQTKQNNRNYNALSEQKEVHQTWRFAALLLAHKRKSCVKEQ